MLGHERYILTSEYESTNQAFMQTFHIPAKLVENCLSAFGRPGDSNKPSFMRQRVAVEFLGFGDANWPPSIRKTTTMVMRVLARLLAFF